MFTRRDRPNLVFPDVSFVTKEALLANAPPPSPWLFDPSDMKNAYTHQWSLRVEREVAKDTKLTVGCVGTRSLHLITVASSGYDEREAQQRFGSRIAGFLQKPYTAAQLTSKVGKLLPSSRVTPSTGK